MSDNKADQGRVTELELWRSLTMPRAFAITMAWGRGFWLNQENGDHEDSVERPTVTDVERVLGEME